MFHSSHALNTQASTSSSSGVWRGDRAVLPHWLTAQDEGPPPTIWTNQEDHQQGNPLSTRRPIPGGNTRRVTSTPGASGPACLPGHQPGIPHEAPPSHTYTAHPTTAPPAPTLATTSPAATHSAVMSLQVSHITAGTTQQTQANQSADYHELSPLFQSLQTRNGSMADTLPSPEDTQPPRCQDCG